MEERMAARSRDLLGRCAVFGVSLGVAASAVAGCHPSETASTRPSAIAPTGPSATAPPRPTDAAGSTSPTGDDAVQVTFSSDLHPKDARWFKAPWPEKDWRYRLSAQAPLWLTRVDAASPLPAISVDSSKTHQSILGLGTSLEETSIYAIAKHHDEAQIKEILSALIDPRGGIGMSLFRLTFGASDFADGRAVSKHPKGFYSYQDDQKGPFSIENDRKLGIIKVTKLAQQVAKDAKQEIRFFASAWSPPGWMKESGQLVSEKGGRLKNEYIQAYAEYLRKAVQAYAAEGIPLYAITTNNEHYFTPPAYPGCYFDFAQEKLLVEALGREFQKAGLTTKVWIVDHNYEHWESANKTLNELRKASASSYAAADGTGFHHYGGEVSSMARLKAAHPDKSIQFTEGAKWGTKGMHEIAQIFRNDAESFVSWVTMTTQTAEEHNQGPYNKPPTLSPVLLMKKDGDGPDWYRIPEYYLYGQFMRFVRPGAVRIDSDPGSEDTVTNVAFKNPDGSIVIVAINQREWVQDQRFVVDGSQFTASIPASTVATYVLKSGLAPRTRAPVGPPDVGPRTLPPTGSGGAVKEWWFAPAGRGDNADRLLKDPRFPGKPTGSATITELKTRDAWKGASATRLRGLIHPTVSGAYTFYISADGSGELYLSTDASPEHKVRICRSPSSSDGFDKDPAQVSAPIRLEAGKAYYFETIQVGGGGKGHTDVGWDIPGIDNQHVIDGKFLSPP